MASTSIARALACWVGHGGAELATLWRRLRQFVLTAGKIAVDETSESVPDPGRGRTEKGFFRAVARDE